MASQCWMWSQGGRRREYEGHGQSMSISFNLINVFHELTSPTASVLPSGLNDKDVAALVRGLALDFMGDPIASKPGTAVARAPKALGRTGPAWRPLHSGVLGGASQERLEAFGRARKCLCETTAPSSRRWSTAVEPAHVAKHALSARLSKPLTDDTVVPRTFLSSKVRPRDCSKFGRVGEAYPRRAAARGELLVAVDLSIVFIHRLVGVEVAAMSGIMCFYVYHAWPTIGNTRGTESSCTARTFHMS
jgi:hypothetical protein